MNKKKKLIPELRFPEFVEDGEWEEKAISQLGKTVNGLTGKKAEDFGTGKPYVQYKQVFDRSFIDFSECGKVSIDDNENQNELQKGDILFTTSSETANEVGFASVLIEQPNEPIYLNSFCFILRPFNLDELKPNFSRYLFHSSIYRKSVNAIAQGAIRYNLSKGAFLDLKLPVPKPQEQQKIASCLSSLDELIAAHNEKLEALKEHKKGLMQNLFPQKGEKVPKLRFPEFEKDGEWVEKKLGDEEVSVFVNDKIDSEKLTLDNYISTDNMLPDYSGVKKATKLPTTYRVTKFIEDDVLMSNIRPYLKKVWKSDRQGGVSNDVLVFRSGSKVISQFLEFVLKNDAFINYVMQSAKGVKMPRGDKDTMLKYSIRIPNPKEQQKIASCLSALDELIKAQTDKIEQLQQHKKGLMQRLFPKMIK
ncbi:restriction endonuclease subunit S [Anaerophaga thermohalophila]|uniref:restriction endonuclease subunit S n=1 Tax=Anaerophaga thermohalophila TaxID=177400 RepID=UPI0002E412F3|nr:restriction endonuclease subunit S [Anaerophaga thermohalophila]